MSPKTKILLVAGTLITVNVLLAAFLFTASARPDSTNIIHAPVAETTPSTMEPSKVSDATSVNVPIKSDVASSATRTPSTASALTRVVLPILATSTVLDAMRAYEKVSDTFSFSGKEYPGLGLFVEEINGVQPTGGRYWMLYVNGEQAAEGVSTLDVTPGDTVEWRYGASIK